MSNPNYTHIVLLVDASGSMTPTKQFTIDGINNFITSQKSSIPSPDERNLSFEDNLSDSSPETRCTVTLVTFSQNTRYGEFNYLNLYGNGNGDGEPEEHFAYTRLYENTNIDAAPQLTHENYYTFGGTPLLDAFSKCIKECSGFINRMNESDRPGRIIIVSITDGIENSSIKVTRKELKELIEEKTALNWQFIYLGANQDAFSESQGIGVLRGQAAGFVQDSQGIDHVFDRLATNVSMKRSCDISHMSTQCISTNEPSNTPDVTLISTNPSLITMADKDKTIKSI